MSKFTSKVFEAKGDMISLSESFDEDTFDREYEEMQQAIWARTDMFSEEEIAEDMAAAIHEVRAEYRARRHTS